MEILYISFGVGILIGAVMVWIWAQWRHNRTLQTECRRLEWELEVYEDSEYSLEAYNEKLQQAKQARKDEIVSYVRECEVVQIRDVAEQLDVSRRTVVRYLTELVEEGVLLQESESGRSAQYRLASITPEHYI